MKRLAVLFLLVFIIGMAPLHLTNAYLRSSEFDLVLVQQNESVWSIAERYTSDPEHTAKLMQAIVEINDLDAEKKLLLPGQQLKIPVLERANVKYAEK